MSKVITVEVSGHYRDATTTVRARIKQTTRGRQYLEINYRQMRSAADRCCYAGTDFPILSEVDGYGYWQRCEDDSLVAYKIEE